MHSPCRQCLIYHTGWMYVIFGMLTTLIKALHAFNMLPKDQNDNIQFEYEKRCSSLQQFSIINQIISCCTMLCLKECHGYYDQKMGEWFDWQIFVVVVSLCGVVFILPFLLGIRLARRCWWRMFFVDAFRGCQVSGGWNARAQRAWQARHPPFPFGSLKSGQVMRKVHHFKQGSLGPPNSMDTCCKTHCVTALLSVNIVRHGVIFLIYTYRSHRLHLEQELCQA